MPTGSAAPTARIPIKAGAGLTPVTYNGMIVVDKQLVSLSNKAGYTAVALPVSEGGQAYLVERVDIISSVAPTSCSLQVNGAEVDFSNSPAHDSFDGNQPIYVPPGSTFAVEWEGGTAAGAGDYTATVQYSVVQFVSLPFPGSS